MSSGSDTCRFASLVEQIKIFIYLQPDLNFKKQGVYERT